MIVSRNDSSLSKNSRDVKVDRFGFIKNCSYKHQVFGQAVPKIEEGKPPYFFSFLIILFVTISSPYNAQISTSLEGYYGKEKTMIAITFDKKISNLFHFGGILKTGSLSVFSYPDFNYDYNDSTFDSNNNILPGYTFPYSENKGSFAGGSTKMTSWSLGTYLSLFRSLSQNKKDWFFIRFDLDFLRLKDSYNFRWSQVEYVGIEKQEKITNDQGVYTYGSIALSSRPGYQRFLDKKNRFFAQVNLGICYYHPLYFNSEGAGYASGTPFMGVEFEVGGGIGYVVKKK